MKQTIIGKPRKDGKQLELVFCVKGRILRYIVPKFKVISEIVLEGAYSDEEWAKNGSDRQNYNMQLKKAYIAFGKKALEDPAIRAQLSEDEIQLLLSGKRPERLTAHHAYPIGDDLVMQLVYKKEHQADTHYGASDMANPRQKEKHIRDNGNWDINRNEKVTSSVYHAMHKHKHITSALVGVASTGFTALFMKKVLKVRNNRVVTGVSLCVGVLCGIASEYYLKSENEKFL